MDILLGKITQQAMNYAIRSGITITSGYAIRQCSRLLKTVDHNDRDELATLQQRLESKIQIISPAIDMIELISARGNTSLESAVTLTKELRWEIQALGTRLAQAATSQEQMRNGSGKARSQAEVEFEFLSIVKDIRRLLTRIEDAVPLINLAITTSGARLSSSLPSTVSPSRLLQASTFLTAGDSQFCMQPSQSVQIGPSFTLTLYMLFSGHSFREEATDGTFRDTTWKEVMHKAKVKLCRTPLDQAYRLGQDIDGGKDAPIFVEGSGRADEFAYQIVIIEDLDDDRVHTLEDGETPPGPYEDVKTAGIVEILPIHEISKIFYADTGKILNIGNDSETNSPILLLKRDPNAIPPRRMMEQRRDEESKYNAEGSIACPGIHEAAELNGNALEPKLQAGNQVSKKQESDAEPSDKVGNPRSKGLPTDLDPEWLAFEVYIEEPDSDTEDEEESSVATKTVAERPKRAATEPPSFLSGLSKLNISTPSPPQSPAQSEPTNIQISPSESVSSQAALLPISSAGPVRSSLSLMEMLIRLTALQQFQQASHLSITDELLNFFLAESSTTGAGSDSQTRQRTRAYARQKVGFDPYDESPVKFRGEDYLRKGADGQNQSENGDWNYSSPPTPDARYSPTSSRFGSPTQAKSDRRAEGAGGSYRESFSSPLDTVKSKRRVAALAREAAPTSQSSPLQKIITPPAD